MNNLKSLYIYFLKFVFRGSLTLGYKYHTMVSSRPTTGSLMGLVLGVAALVGIGFVMETNNTKLALDEVRKLRDSYSDIQIQNTRVIAYLVKQQQQEQQQQQNQQKRERHVQRQQQQHQEKYERVVQDIVRKIDTLRMDSNLEAKNTRDYYLDLVRRIEKCEKTKQPSECVIDFNDQ